MSSKDTPTPAKKHNRRNIAKAFSILLLLVFFTLCGMIAFNLYSTYQTHELSQQLSEIRNISKEENPEDWSRGMLEVNPDYVGWLNVIGTEINGPVVQGEDNNEYLRRDIYGDYSVAGTFFLDEEVDLSTENGNVMIYGHLMNDETMFGPLKHYKSTEFFQENNLIRWETQNGVSYYRIFAAMIVSGYADTERYLNLQSWMNNIDEKTEQEMLKEIQDASFIFQENMFRSGPYIFLVTCDYGINNGRLVLVGEKI